MKIIKTTEISDAVYEMFDGICCNVDLSARKALLEAEAKESHTLGKWALTIMNKNIEMASEKHIAACQDTGMAVVFLEIGSEVYIDGNIEEAVNSGVRKAYDKCFRKSVLDPITRLNTKDNTPAVIHYEITKGDTLKISAMAKGFGSENMSGLYMLTPADGVEGIKKAVIDRVRRSGGSACPPLIVGVGIGGTMEKAALLAKKSLMRDVGSLNARDDIRKLEKEILDEINSTRIGAQGFGGDTTALAVFIETYPTHIAGLPVAVNIQCHCSRHAVRVF